MQRTAASSQKLVPSRLSNPGNAKYSIRMCRIIAMIRPEDVLPSELELLSESEEDDEPESDDDELSESDELESL